jgi:urease accessory protein|tara:strand:+ start:452 stop:1033 length:582 start_codon:yes stop_codon:yes gene_type:complete
MTPLKLTLLTSFTAFITTLAPSAFAHSLPMESSLLTGFVHPLLGLDHLLAMLAVGFWAAQQRGKNTRTIPLVFISALLIGFLLGLNAVTLVAIETGISLSVLILGLLIVSAARLPMTLSLPLIGSFALYHGIAHGAEVGVAHAALFATGFIGSTALLHLAGVQSAFLVQRYTPLIGKVAGAGIALMGAMLLMA